MIKAFSEGDKVILDLCGRRRDVLLACDDALKLAEALDRHAVDAERAPPEMNRLRPWGVKVESWDGLVNLRLDPPEVGDPDRVPLPAQIARRLAELIREKSSMARVNVSELLVKGA